MTNRNYVPFTGTPLKRLNSKITLARVIHKEGVITSEELEKILFSLRKDFLKLTQ